MTPPGGRPPHAQLHLPPLSAAEALTVVAILERAVAAVWRAHGDAMADELALRGVDTPKPPEAVDVGTPDIDPDINF